MARELRRETIRDKAVEIVRQHPGGIRYSDLMQALAVALPDFPPNTIQGSAYDLHKSRPDSVVKAERGVFRPVGSQGGDPQPVAPRPSKYMEEDFYAPFAEYLENELENCNKAIALGGKLFQMKWGTPDVLGVYKSSRGDPVDFQTEVICAEIKTVPGETITAFGQAVSYRLFATKSYLVLPETIPQDEQDRIESLCLLFGLGLVLFDPAKTTQDTFKIRVRAMRHTPDFFYVNQIAERLKEKDRDKFTLLFG